MVRKSSEHRSRRPRRPQRPKPPAAVDDVLRRVRVATNNIMEPANEKLRSALKSHHPALLGTRQILFVPRELEHEHNALLERLPKPFASVIHPPRRHDLKSLFHRWRRPHVFERHHASNGAPLRLASDGVRQANGVLPPDPILESGLMTIVLTKHIKGITINSLYDACWSGSTFYHDWLTEDEKDDIEVGPWQVGSFQNDFDKEVYSQKRVVTYSYTRDPHTLGYNLGKPVVHVTQTHFYRCNDGDDGGKQGTTRSILAIQMKMEGEVGSDSFVVHIRGVATNASSTTNGAPTNSLPSSEPAALLLDFGVGIVFTKPSLLKNQIRSIVQGATRQSMGDLFHAIVEACGEGATEIERDDALVQDDIADKRRMATDDKHCACWCC
mmetsp:Transcript_46871/g.69700  ORF Transcript_46871/g.69700 Transcript_46871/m.69700 type:complete len:383 (-) Transcript_46871:37-1185(-)